jgi:hypothetical protein
VPALPAPRVLVVTRVEGEGPPSPYCVWCGEVQRTFE